MRTILLPERRINELEEIIKMTSTRNEKLTKTGPRVFMLKAKHPKQTREPIGIQLRSDVQSGSEFQCLSLISAHVPMLQAGVDIKF